MEAIFSLVLAAIFWLIGSLAVYFALVIEAGVWVSLSPAFIAGSGLWFLGLFVTFLVWTSSV